jgi:hypothetical protein
MLGDDGAHARLVSGFGGFDQRLDPEHRQSVIGYRASA